MVRSGQPFTKNPKLQLNITSLVQFLTIFIYISQIFYNVESVLIYVYY